MPTSADPLAAYTIGELLLGCAADGIEHAPGGAGLPGRQCVVWGGIAWDCDCGQLVVAIGRQAPSSNFPQEGVTGPMGKCGPNIWMVNYTISILRCVPVQSDQGTPPLCADIDASARLLAIDAWAVRNAVACCLTSMQKDQTEGGHTAIANYLIRDQLAVGPEGACAGSDLNVLVGLRNCWCVEPAP